MSYLLFFCFDVLLSRRRVAHPYFHMFFIQQQLLKSKSAFYSFINTSYRPLYSGSLLRTRFLVPLTIRARSYILCLSELHLQPLLERHDNTH